MTCAVVEKYRWMLSLRLSAHCRPLPLTHCHSCTFRTSPYNPHVTDYMYICMYVPMNLGSM